jgi:hypothetical protein
MKLKIRFAKETRFVVPNLQLVQIRTWTQSLFGTRHSLRSLAIAEIQKPSNHRHD